ncbi:MAG: hypothetical protein L0G25_07765 [Psychrobacter sp.]|nr:hypothetical protein [Psychrobacter sp.]
MTLVYSMEIGSAYVGIQKHSAAIGGTGIILSLIVALSTIAIVVGARKFSDNQSVSASYRQA